MPSSSDGLQRLDWLARIALVGLSGLGILNTEWFGRKMFEAYQEVLHANVAEVPSEPLYSQWLKDSFRVSPEEIQGYWILLGVLLIIGLTAHVLARSVADRTIHARSLTARHPLLRIYAQSYDGWTAVFFAALIVLYFFSGLQHGLALILLSIAVPGVLYLFFYSADLASPKYLRLLLYVLLLLSLGMVAIAWPWRYGTRAFDLRVIPVDGNSESRCTTPVFRNEGPLFQLSGRGDQYVRLCVNREGTGRVLYFFTGEKKPPFTAVDAASLKQILAVASPFARPDASGREETLSKVLEVTSQ